MLEKTNYDVVIMGTGPAGLQAAIHAARKNVSVLVMGKESKSSLFHAHVENFCFLFNIAGVFAAGDVCGPPWQMAKAVGEGCVAGIGAATYAKKAEKSSP
jgi:thioredoxin reductase